MPIGIDWMSSMQQTFEFFKVDPNTWRDSKKISMITKCTIDRDLGDETLGSANISITGEEFFDEFYLRVYLVVVQNGRTFPKIPLGTFLIQANSSESDGTKVDITIDAYTPLMELKENKPPIGFAVLEGDSIMERVTRITNENIRAPVVISSSNSDVVQNEGGYVSEWDDSWLSYLTNLLQGTKYRFDLDDMGTILFAPEQDISTMGVVWTYTDDNSSILLPTISMERNLYEIPNVVEILHSTASDYYLATAINDDPNSPISTVTRGRKVVYRERNETSITDHAELDAYATEKLKSLSAIEYTLSYVHGYNGVRVGDCVQLNYHRANIVNVKAKVVRQSISCEPGCPVSETATFTSKLWR